jgi:hypothetical protein
VLQIFSKNIYDKIRTRGARINYNGWGSGAILADERRVYYFLVIL